jgi:hypothetical protein
VLVSNGHLLNEGDLSDTSQVQVYVSEVEQAIYIEALVGNGNANGKWSDGSYRAVLIQFNHNLTAGSPLSGELRFGGGISRGTSDIGKTTPPYEPAAIAVPSDPVDACARVGLFGPLTPDSVALRLLPNRRIVNMPRRRNFYNETHTDAWMKLREYFDWINAAQTPSPTGNGASYDMVTMFWQDWARTGDTASWQTAFNLLNTRRTHGTVYGRTPDVSWTGEQWVNPWDAALGYYLTGSADYLTLAGELADGQMHRTWNYLGNRFDTDNGSNDRLAYTATQSCLVAYLLDADTNALGYNDYLGSTTLDANITDILAQQDDDGKWGGIGNPTLYDGQKTFMASMLAWGMINYHRFYDLDHLDLG